MRKAIAFLRELPPSSIKRMTTRRPRRGSLQKRFTLSLINDSKLIMTKTIYR